MTWLRRSEHIVAAGFGGAGAAEPGPDDEPIQDSVHTLVRLARTRIVVGRRSRTRLVGGVLTGAVLAATVAGCASRPINVPIAHVDTAHGYRATVRVPSRVNNDPTTFFMLAFSGGGTRAAALSYGVLEELRRTDVVLEGRHTTLLDEVDVISGVSGGSFTALSYALYGDQLFTEYETRFLKRDVQGTLIRRALNPFNWPKLIGGTYGRSELAADYYDEILFRGATFADLLVRPRPMVMVTATDISTGARVAFTQPDFDLLCSDLSKVRLARAAAASSAVPVVLSPVTFNNYGGTCGFENPPWVQDSAAHTHRGEPPGRPGLRYRDMQDLQNSAKRPYIHLVDGGVSDNLGLRAILEHLESIEASAAFRDALAASQVHRLVLIVVNSHSSPSIDWDKHEHPPGFVSQLLQSSSIPIDRYSYESVDLMKDIVRRWALLRESQIARARLAGQSEAEANASVPPLDAYAIDISFDQIADPDERAYFMNLPTSFVLKPEAVDGLRAIAGKLLRQSADYQKLVQDLGGARTN